MCVSVSVCVSMCLCELHLKRIDIFGCHFLAFGCCFGPLFPPVPKIGKSPSHTNGVQQKEKQARCGVRSNDDLTVIKLSSQFFSINSIPVIFKALLIYWLLVMQKKWIKTYKAIIAISQQMTINSYIAFHQTHTHTHTHTLIRISW